MALSKLQIREKRGVRDVSNLSVTDHSVIRYLERVRTTHLEYKILEIVAYGMEMIPADAATKLMAKRFKNSKYYQLYGVIAVVKDNAVVTVFKCNYMKWKPAEEA